MRIPAKFSLSVLYERIDYRVSMVFLLLLKVRGLPKATKVEEFAHHLRSHCRNAKAVALDFARKSNVLCTIEFLNTSDRDASWDRL